MKIVIAVVRREKVENIVKFLKDAGIPGMTISEIMGIGEEVGIDKPYTIHYKIEIMVSNDMADSVANVITAHAHSGLSGDGIIAVYPVDYAIKIRTKEKIKQ